MTNRIEDPDQPEDQTEPTIRKVEGGFPHSEIPGSKLVRSSPRLIAAYHVLHRLSAPRHPPNALKTLDRFHDRCPLVIRQPLSGGQSQNETRSKKQKDRSSLLFRRNNLMLAEHNRTGPALAANPATFPLNDVSYLPAPHGPDDQSRVAKLVFSGCGPTTAIAPRPIWGDRQCGTTDNGGASRDRTDDLMLAKQPLSQLSYGPNLRSRRSSVIEANPNMVGLGRLERPTSPLSGVRSNHLSYRPRMIRHIPLNGVPITLSGMRKRNEDGAVPPIGF